MHPHRRLQRTGVARPLPAPARAAVSSDAGLATAEFAVVLLAVAFVVQVLLSGISIVTGSLQVVDAAHIAVRLAARGESDQVIARAARGVAPHVTITVTRADGVVRVSASQPTAGVFTRRIVPTLRSSASSIDETALGSAAGNSDLGGAAP